MKEFLRELEEEGLAIEYCLHTGGCLDESDLAALAARIAGHVAGMREAMGMGPDGKELFDWLYDTWDITALDSEMNDLRHFIAGELHLRNKQLACEVGRLRGLLGDKAA